MKYVSKVLVVVFIVSCFINTSVPTLYGWDQNDEITKANSYIEKTYGYVNYYTDYTMINTKDKDSEKYSFKRYDLNSKVLTEGEPAFHKKPLVLYGSATEATDEYFAGKDSGSPAGKHSARNDAYRTLGFTYEGCPFPNPWFPNDYYVVNGKEVANTNDSFDVDKTPIGLKESYRDDSGKHWIEGPYDILDNGTTTRELSSAMPNGSKKVTVGSGTAKMINSWVRTKTFRPDKMLNDRKLLSKLVVNPPKSVKDNFEDYLAVLSPPTDNTWGIGVAFYYKSNGDSRYSIFYLRPKNMLKNDLYAGFEFISHVPTKKVDTDDKVSVGIKIDSTSKVALSDIDYKLIVKDDKGNPIQHTLVKAQNLVMSADKMNLPASFTEFIVNFTMPDTPVNIEFSINPSGKNPDEDILSNNKISTRFLPNAPIPFDFDYNINSKSVKFPLENYSIDATLSLPKGWWSGNATGSLGVTNKTPTLLKDFKVSNNPAVNEASDHIKRNPYISTTFLRRDFGDDPINKVWLPGPQSITKYGNIDYSGSVSRGYSYTFYDGCISHPDGTTSCPGHTGTGTASADFLSDTKKCKVEAYVYNGDDTIKPIVYKNDIEDIKNTSMKNGKKMFWTSEPFEFNVFRMMYHKNESNKLEDPIEVPGKYKRSFINQNEATTGWTVKSPMLKDYDDNRKAARQMKTNKGLVKKAVFASDRKFKSVENPIKSGYYFNPTGTYTFNITTYAHKPTKNPTKDHADLVEAFIKAFRYESNLVYQDKNGNAVDLLNRSATRGTKGYTVKSPAVLKFTDLDKAHWPRGLNNEVWLEFSKDYDIDSEEIKYPKSITEQLNPDHMSINTSINAVAGLDDRWKNILEGYTNSGTNSSFKKYRYREYVSSNQTMYKIKETSTVTIKVNPSNKVAYTHKAMKGDDKDYEDYTIKVYIDDVSFKKHTGAYSNLPILHGLSTLDKIDIKVVGSKDDDINFN